MAAITNNVESHELDAGEFERSDVETSGGALRGLGAAAVNQKSLAKSHTMLTKFAWLRTLLERELQKRSYSLVREGNGQYNFYVKPGFDKNTLPWAPFSFDGYNRFGLWSVNNAKMACPSFALPAGGVLTGGTCPGADAGQTISPVQQRVARLESQPDGWHLKVNAPGSNVKPLVKEGLTICSSCYATGGNFAYANNQVREIICYWWLRKHLQAGNEKMLLDVLVDSIAHLPFKRTFVHKKKNKDTGRTEVVGTFHERTAIKPIRLHDSGDFFSQKYAELWIQVADTLAERMPEVVIWAPTRTWAQGGWSEFWANRLGSLRSLKTAGRPNLVVRASGYNFGDAAPGQLHPANAKGTTSLFATHAKVDEALRNRTDATQVGLTQGAEPRVDFNCGVYGAEKHSCVGSKAPDGEVGCRACWTQPALSINYSAH